MKKVKITAVRRTCYPDLMELYENPIEHACDMKLEDAVFVFSDVQSCQEMLAYIQENFPN